MRRGLIKAVIVSAIVEHSFFEGEEIVELREFLPHPS